MAETYYLRQSDTVVVLWQLFGDVDSDGRVAASQVDSSEVKRLPRAEFMAAPMVFRCTVDGDELGLFTYEMLIDPNNEDQFEYAEALVGMATGGEYSQGGGSGPTFKTVRIA